MKSPATQRDRTFPVGSIVGIVMLYLIGLGVITVAAVHASSGKVVAQTPTTHVKVTLSEFKIGGTLTAPAGHVIIDVTNGGSVDHNLTAYTGTRSTRTIPAGGAATLDLGVVSAKSIPLYCSVPGHKESGMTATLTVTKSTASTSDTASMAGMDMSGSAASSGGTPDYEKMDADMLASFKAYPAKTTGEGNQVLNPTVLPDGVKQFELTAAITDWEVSPGKKVKAWTYNGMVPGPMLKLAVGDHIRVVVHNKLPVTTDVHWHGIEVPFAMDGVAPITQDPIKPGSDFTYDFTVDRPYMGMYHAHMHGVTAVPDGLFGVIQVGDTPIAKGVTVNGMNVPTDVKPVVDMPMVLNDAGVIGLSLNGKAFPATAPIVVNQGDWIAVTYYNEGLQSHPMHLHEFPQLVTAEDGYPLANPYWVDTLLVAPGQRFTVMMHATDKGTWVWHCHILNHVESDAGMIGMVTALIVK